jgi:endonuclease-3 related protein
MNTKPPIARAVDCLFEAYGPQGWWPVRGERRRFRNPSGEREQHGYHPSEFDFPRSRSGRWEIVCGAVLTQNTAWTNVERALVAMSEAKLTSPEATLGCTLVELGELIRPAGYFNQKSRYLVAVAEWFTNSDKSLSKAEPTRARLDQVRPELLRVRGVGPETADSILLYAYAMPTFVVDAYTRRVFGRLGLVEPDWSYERIRALFEQSLASMDVGATVRSWQEAHALIVEHAKRCHGRNHDPQMDFLLKRLGLFARDATVRR